jgi:hypothetical protein
MTRKTRMLGGVIAAALVAGGVALAQPFGGSHGAGRHGEGPRWMQAQRGESGGHGPGMGRQGIGPGMGARANGLDAATGPEMQDIRAMFMNNESIRRTVENLPNGIRTVTESDAPRLADVLRRHVAEMGQRIEEGRDPGLPIESPELRFLFEARARIVSQYAVTERGIMVTQTSEDSAVVAALQKHAADVSDLAERGRVAAREAMMRNRFGGNAAPTR